VNADPFDFGRRTEALGAFVSLWLIFCVLSAHCVSVPNRAVRSRS